MATYVIGDIHGRYYHLMDVLNQAKFDIEKDELYVLGDICDRGGHSDKVLEWAYNQPECVHFLFGNHEDFLVSDMRRWEKYIDGVKFDVDYELNAFKYDFYNMSIWLQWNGGIETFEYLSNLPKSKREDIVNWIASWPLFYDITVNGQRYVLVHAGLAPRGVRLSDDRYDRGRKDYVKIDGLHREQFAQTLLWVRNNWFVENSQDLPFTTIFGHTNTGHIYDLLVWVDEDKEMYQVEGEPFKILKFHGNKIAMDCGLQTLGLLRLDDMQEFYSDIKE